jgi:hypothetical protein
VQKLKDATPAGVLLGSCKLAAELAAQHATPELVSAKPIRSGAVPMHYRRAR